MRYIKYTILFAVGLMLLALLLIGLFIIASQIVDHAHTIGNF